MLPGTHHGPIFSVPIMNQMTIVHDESQKRCNGIHCKSNITANSNDTTTSATITNATTSNATTTTHNATSFQDENFVFSNSSWAPLNKTVRLENFIVGGKPQSDILSKLHNASFSKSNSVENMHDKSPQLLTLGKELVNFSSDAAMNDQSPKAPPLKELAASLDGGMYMVKHIKNSLDITVNNNNTSQVTLMGKYPVMPSFNHIQIKHY